MSKKQASSVSRPRRRASHTHFFRYQQTNNPSKLEEKDLQRALIASIEDFACLTDTDTDTLDSFQNEDQNRKKTKKKYKVKNKNKNNVTNTKGLNNHKIAKNTSSKGSKSLPASPCAVDIKDISKPLPSTATLKKTKNVNSLGVKSSASHRHSNNYANNDANNNTNHTNNNNHLTMTSTKLCKHKIPFDSSPFGSSSLTSTTNCNHLNHHSNATTNDEHHSDRRSDHRRHKHIEELFPNKRPKTEDFLTYLCLPNKPDDDEDEDDEKFDNKVQTNDNSTGIKSSPIRTKS